MDLELILFKACPFAQRVVITFLQTKLPHRGTWINPAQKPEWLHTIAPLGQIPLLRVDGDTVLFDSSAINEYLNDLTGGGLLPDAALERAQCRAWIDFSGVCQRAFGTLIMARDGTQFHEAGKDLLGKLNWLEKRLEANSLFFIQNRLSLVDVAYAPLFMRMQHLQAITPFYQAAHFPNINHWQTHLLTLEVVQQSVKGDFASIFQNVVRGRGKGGFVDAHLA